MNLGTSLHHVDHFSLLIYRLSVVFIRQQTNAVAHALAEKVTFLASPVVYFNIPSCIETLIINKII